MHSLIVNVARLLVQHTVVVECDGESWGFRLTDASSRECSRGRASIKASNSGRVAQGCIASGYGDRGVLRRDEYNSMTGAVGNPKWRLRMFLDNRGVRSASKAASPCPSGLVCGQPCPAGCLFRTRYELREWMHNGQWRLEKRWRAVEDAQSRHTREHVLSASTSFCRLSMTLSQVSWGRQWAREILDP